MLLTSGPAWSVIVIDGVSVADNEREQLLRTMSRPTFATVLYIASRMPSDLETAHASWPSDMIVQGVGFDERLRRRVQNLALAPWRASAALRSEAEPSSASTTRLNGYPRAGGVRRAC